MVTGLYMYNAPPLRPLLHAGWKKRGMVLAVKLDTGRLSFTSSWNNCAPCIRVFTHCHVKVLWEGGGGRRASSTAPAHQPLASANADTSRTPAGAQAAAADRKQRPDAAREGKNG